MRSSGHDGQRELDEVLGIVRCARCGHRLDGHAECPFCAVVETAPGREGLPVWTFVTACIITSPAGLIGILGTRRLSAPGKAAASAASMLWTWLLVRYVLFS